MAKLDASERENYCGVATHAEWVTIWSHDSRPVYGAFELYARIARQVR